MRRTERSWPWVPGDEVEFLIEDRCAPANHDDFEELVRYLAVQLDAGFKVHVGCIGGHGRTGMVLAALVAHFEHSPDPIGYVREYYCAKAVESIEQVAYLVTRWGCTPHPVRDALTKAK